MDKEDIERKERLLKKIEECPSERCKEAMKEAVIETLNKENSTSEKHE